MLVFKDPYRGGRFLRPLLPNRWILWLLRTHWSANAARLYNCCAN